MPLASVMSVGDLTNPTSRRSGTLTVAPTSGLLPLATSRIHGRILDVANGNKPLVGATVSVPDLRDVGLVKSPTDITDIDGIYDLTIYDVPRDLKLSVFKDDGRPT